MSSRRHDVAVETWVPVDSCTLPTAEQPLRAAEFDGLFAADLRAVREDGAERVVLVFTDRPGLATTIEELTLRESECCSFFTFSLSAVGTHLELVVEVPPAQVGVLAGLAGRARSTVGKDRG